MFIEYFIFIIIKIVTLSIYTFILYKILIMYVYKHTYII